MAVFRVIPFCENTIPLFINYKILTIKVLYQKIPQKFPLFCDSMARPLSCLAIAGIKMNICERERSVSKLLKLLATCEQEKTLKTGCFKGFCVFCGLVGIRTPNLLIRSQMLYPIELRNHIFLCISHCFGTAKVELYKEKSNIILLKIYFYLSSI